MMISRNFLGMPTNQFGSKKSVKALVSTRKAKSTERSYECFGGIITETGIRADQFSLVHRAYFVHNCERIFEVYYFKVRREKAIASFSLWLITCFLSWVARRSRRRCSFCYLLFLSIAQLVENFLQISAIRTLNERFWTIWPFTR